MKLTVQEKQENLNKTSKINKKIHEGCIQNDITFHRSVLILMEIAESYIRE